MDELVAEAIDRCRHQAGTKQITMATGGTADLHVWGNRGQLAAALGNLVENAVNYSPARTRVGIAARSVTAPGGDLIEIAVTDQASASPTRTRNASSSASTASTRPAHVPRVARAWAWPS